MGELKLPPVADSDRLKTEGHCQTLRGILPEDLQLGGSPVQGSHDGRIAGGDVPKACCQSVGVPHLRSWWGLRPMLNCRCQSLQKAEGVTVEYLNPKLCFFPPVHHTGHPIPSAALLKVLYLQLLDRPPGMYGQRGCCFSLT